MTEHWNNMPEFKQESKAAFARVTLNFENQEDMDKFNEVTNLKITRKTKGVFYPIKEVERVKYISEDA